MFMIALTGGKTGGHVTPLLSVCEQLTEDVLYVGNENSLEERCCQKENIPFFPIHFPKMNLFRAVWESFRLFQKLPQKPKAICQCAFVVVWYFSSCPDLSSGRKRRDGKLQSFFFFLGRKGISFLPRFENEKKVSGGGSTAAEDRIFLW